jgi:soluble lytic murein transglycosylase-like protein
MRLYSFIPLSIRLSLASVSLVSSVAVIPQVTEGDAPSLEDPLSTMGLDQAPDITTAFNQYQTLASSDNPLPLSQVRITFPQPKKVNKPVVLASKTEVAPAAPQQTAPAPTAAPIVRIYPESQYEAWFEQYGSQFGVEPELLKKIAYCESHYNPGAKNGPYGGMYQYLDSTWQATRNLMGLDPDPNLRYDAEQSIMTSAFKIKAGGIRAWPVCAFK